MQEKQGNVLVFMSTVAGVNELVQAVCKALAHDPGCIVLGLYADMNDDEKARVTSFHDLSKFPQNRQKRLICVATDLAESGVTIPGRTATTNDPRVCAVPVNDLLSRADHVPAVVQPHFRPLQWCLQHKPCTVMLSEQVR